jgi:hypothetical protein
MGGAEDRFMGIPSGKYCSGDLDVDGSMILKWVLERQDMRVWTEFIWLKIR